MKLIYKLIISLLLLASAGCQQRHQNTILTPPNRLLDQQFNHPPQIRIGSYATPTLGTFFLDINHLGHHSYKFSFSEREGIVYTCKAGHIDIAHVNEAADWTAYSAAITYKHLIRDDTVFTFRLKEGSICFVRLTYPNTWQKLTQKDKDTIAFDIAVKLGRYFGYTAGTWHEILTWFGYKSTGIFPEFPSAFSWEDIFSNLLGSDIAAEALRDKKHTYDDAVTYILRKKLEELNIQSAKTARKAAEKVRGKWFSGEVPPFVNMKGRNFDTGLDDGFVTPWIVSSIRQCRGQKAQPYPVPKLDFLGKYGFSIKFEIAPHVWEGRKILKIVYHNKNPEHKRIEPIKDFAPIMKEIIQQARKRGYY